MARKPSLKMLQNTFAKIAEDYFKAANQKGLSPSMQEYMTARWALFREVAMAVNGRAESLDNMALDAANWLKSCEQVAVEADPNWNGSHPTGQS